MLAAAPLAALLALALACARADLTRHGEAVRIFLANDRNSRAIGSETGGGCLYEGRWFVEGAGVSARDACLRCACARGALSCARRACASPPDPPPPRCHLRHRRGACCPELHCPDGVTVLEQAATARLEDDYSDVATPVSPAHACVEGGTVYAAGSAMTSRTACEQCFCLRGARRCVRPRCLPAPPACAPRPAPGACCPQRYYCERLTTLPPHLPHPHDCNVDGQWISEGERVPSAEIGANCTQCFCLRGAARCQPQACAPPLHGCRPLLRAGQCCPHQYTCDHHKRDQVTPPLLAITDNALISTRYDDRSFHTSKSSKHETTTKTVSSSFSTTKEALTMSATRKQPASTAKVKRKTNDPPPSTSHKPEKNITATTSTTTQTPTTTTTVAYAAKHAALKVETTTTEESSEPTSTEQPEGSVKIIINGTINCTAELSTSLPLNSSANESETVQVESEPRIPYVSGSVIDAQTSNPNDIITEGYGHVGYDENETFTINVTSSLRANTSHSTATPAPSAAATTPAPIDLNSALNISKKTKEDYDYDYAEPTLPPSLPNLKIIPFVAADAVVEDDVSSKTSITYPILEREDKFPVYYPTVESKVGPFANRREDTYDPTQYPVFVSNKVEPAQYPSLAHDVDLTNAAYPSVNNDLATAMHDYTVSTSIGSQVPEVKNKVVTKPPSTSTTFEIKAPAVNLFSPPVETEGGFIPKGPGIIDEYYAVYPSTPPGPPAPHLTTSMQLDTGKEGECVTGDGRRVPEGDAVSLACSVCTCAWGALHCAPRPCLTPAGCARRPATSSAVDLCCGELVCDKDNKSTALLGLPTRKTEITLNETKVPIEINTEIIPFDPPSDRSVPPPAEDVKHDTDYDGTDVKNDNETTSHHQHLDKNGTSTTSNKTTTVPVTTHSSVTTNSTEKISTTSVTTTTTLRPERQEPQTFDTKNQSQEYEDEEEDEGFSFGSVLKLLLSDSYDTTTTSPYKKPDPAPTRTIITTTTPLPISTTKRLIPKPTVPSFVPLPHHQYIPPKNILPQNTVNRIDHLVLGEATAIKKTTPRPTTPFRITSRKPFTTKPTTPKPTDTTRLGVTRKEELSVQYTSVSHEVPRPSAGGLPGVGGLLKLAGCNIYGQMYRVGRIIAELSTACQECRCTELGVQCRDLRC